MPNRLKIIPTIFTDERSGSQTYGYRAYDDDGQTYYTGWDEIPDNDLDVLALALSDPDYVLSGMFDFVRGYEEGVYISDTYYGWDEIKYLFDDEEGE